MLQRRGDRGTGGIANIDHQQPALVIRHKGVVSRDRDIHRAVRRVVGSHECGVRGIADVDHLEPVIVVGDKGVVTRDSNLLTLGTARVASHERRHERKELELPGHRVPFGRCVGYVLVPRRCEIFAVLMFDGANGKSG